MYLLPLKTPLITSGQDLLPILNEVLKQAGETLKEKDILVIASKIVAYSQGKLVAITGKAEFREWVKKEADVVLDEGDMILTLKNKILIPNSGIDNSNTPDGEIVLWPKEPFQAARELRERIKKEYGLNELGVLISDSHCQPLRQGTTGLAIGWAGFEGVQDERGAEDLFGRKMQYTQIAVGDNLASAALLEMGETNASVPFVIARHVSVQWSESFFSEEDYSIDPEDCLYSPLYGSSLRMG